MISMTLYLAVISNYTLMDGDYEEVLGVYDSYDRAKKALEAQGVWFSQASELSHGKIWRYIFDGELSIYYSIEEVKLNAPRGYSEEDASSIVAQDAVELDE